MEFDHALAFWGEHLVKLAIWVVLALSLNLINGCCGLFSLGHQGFWAAGAYTAALVMKFSPHHAGANWTGFMLSFPAAFLVAAGFGLLVGVPCLRLRGDYLAIATLGFSEILRNVIQNSETLGFSFGFKFPDDAVASGLSKNAKYYLFLALAWSAVALVAIVLRNLMRSPHGRAILAVRDDERAAELLGVNLTFDKVFVFVLGAGMAGLAGALFANYTAFVTVKDFDFNQGVLMVVMVVLGGMGNMLGTFIAATVLYFIPVLLALWLPELQVPVFYDPTQNGVVYCDIKSLWQVFYALLLIVAVLVRPQGMMHGLHLWGPKKSAPQLIGKI